MTKIEEQPTFELLSDLRLIENQINDLIYEKQNIESKIELLMIKHKMISLELNKRMPTYKILKFKRKGE